MGKYDTMQCPECKQTFNLCSGHNCMLINGGVEIRVEIPPVDEPLTQAEFEKYRTVVRTGAVPEGYTEPADPTERAIRIYCFCEEWYSADWMESRWLRRTWIPETMPKRVRDIIRAEIEQCDAFVQKAITRARAMSRVERQAIAQQVTPYFFSTIGQAPKPDEALAPKTITPVYTFEPERPIQGFQLKTKEPAEPEWQEWERGIDLDD